MSCASRTTREPKTPESNRSVVTDRIPPLEAGHPGARDGTVLCPAQLPGTLGPLAADDLIGINSREVMPGHPRPFRVVKRSATSAYALCTRVPRHHQGATGACP